jgi:RNA polymerase sigma factor (TIGR02999 family)
MNPRDLRSSLYNELRKLAEAKMEHENPGHSLTATALVHEVWMKLERGKSKCADRKHFLCIAAIVMRQILVDHARSAKPMWNVSLPEVAASQRPEDLIALDVALKKLAVEKPKHAELIELRFFAGATNDEAAEVLGITPAAAKYLWRYACAWLKTELKKGDR